MQTVVIVNESTVVSDAAVQAMCAALQVQVSRDFAPAWGVDAHVYFLAKDAPIPDGAWVLAILDDSDQADALGYHELGPMGEPMGKVFAKADIENGSSLSVTVSHELLEMLGDPDANLCAQAGDRMYAYEACDPVEADELGYQINNIQVSDFILPTWFGVGGTDKYDFMGHLTSSFQIADGGYCSMLQLSGSDGWQQLTQRSEVGAAVPKGSRRAKRRIELSLRRRSERR